MALLHVGRNDEAGFFYYVMELADDAERGREVEPATYLPLTLAALRAKRGRLLADECIRYGVEVARALAGLHAHGLVHRDIKPSNVMLVVYGTTTFRARARLADFGIASGFPATTEKETGATTGTAAYLSPEQALREAATSASDIYSFGLVLLECFTRTVSFPGSPVASAMARVQADPPIPAGLPDGWSELLARMTDHDPARRPTAEQLTPVFREAVIRARRVVG
jgi:serine/threonine protein kinase